MTGPLLPLEGRKIAIDIDKSDFKPVHISRISPRKQSPRKSPQKHETKLQHSPPLPVSSTPSGCGQKGQRSRPLDPASARWWYLEGCACGEDVEVDYVMSEGELLEELVKLVRR